MPAVETIGDDPQALRRSLRDLVAVSMLPVVWTKYDARQIAESVTEVLIRMIGLEFAYVALRWGGEQPEVHVARTGGGTGPDRTAAIRGALEPWVGGSPPGEVVALANPIGSDAVRVAFTPVAAGEHATLVAASCDPDFPSAVERLLLEVVANQAAVAIRRWQAEHALQRLNDTLEERVTAEIKERMKVEEAFRQAQKMEAIGQLTGGIAHDFNNLLGAVLNNLKLLRRRLADDAGAVRLIDGAVEGAERGASLTRRLLAFTRQQDLKPATVDAAELIRGMIEMLRRSIGPTIDVETDFAADLWPAHVDANQLELALLNLVVNARDAMPDGGRLRLSACNETVAAGGGDGAVAAGDYVRLAVADTGTGMDETTLERAIDPFFTTKGTGKGTGLGLPMVHGLAAQSGGALHLSSRPGAGTTAELRLPRAEDVPAAATGAAPADGPRACKVLLVEDDALVSMATAEMLKDLGHRVVEAPSGRRALEILRGGTAVDVVMTDQAMPGMTGTQLAAEIRDAWPGLPVILVTGYAELPKEGGPELPRLDKPYDEAKLAAALAELVDGAPPA